MGPMLVLTVALALPLGRRALGLSCTKDTYALGSQKCCKKCSPDTPGRLQRPGVRTGCSPAVPRFPLPSSPGYELTVRCTRSTETSCEPCDEHYYNAVYTESRCKRCTVCERERGLQEMKPCDQFSNTRCACLPGYKEVAGHAVSEGDKRCEPCPDGYFSKGGKDKCHPWTNCTAKGLKLLRAGKRDEDAICDEPASHRSGATPTVRRPTSFTKEPGEQATPSWIYRSTLDARLMAEKKPAESGIFMVVVVVAVLAVMLFVAGGVGLWLYFQKAKDKKWQGRLGAFSDVPQEDGKSSYRIPIQEEQVDHKPSLPWN